MCYRYLLVRRDLARAAEKLRARLAAEGVDRHNIPPGGPIAAVLQGSDGDRHVASLRWGLVPRWAEDPAALGASLANARSETVASKPSFRDAFRKRRCLVPASGFYEWEKAPGGRRLPWLLRRRDGAPLLFAGLWESWSPPADASAAEAAEAPLLTCTILTTGPNSLLSPFHDRMPVILPDESCDAWLDPAHTDDGALQSFLRSYPAEAMTAVRVSQRVNAVANDDPACSEPLAEEAVPAADLQACDGAQLNLGF